MQLPINSRTNAVTVSKVPPTQEAVSRILSDYKAVLKARNSHIHVVLDEDDITHVQVLIIGPQDTPYADGFFHFEAQYPHDYPWRPPKVTLMTTDNGAVRFNPNLYANGKVCLSILGTWDGPGWTSVQTMLSTFISIQSLMNHAPYHNEPGHEEESRIGDAQKYSDCIQHETLRAAVCGMMEHPTWGDLAEFNEAMKDHFLKNYSRYTELAASKAAQFDGKPMIDPLYSQNLGKFNYGSILQKLDKIKKSIEDGTYDPCRKESVITKNEELPAKLPTVTLFQSTPLPQPAVSNSIASQTTPGSSQPSIPYLLPHPIQTISAQAEQSVNPLVPSPVSKSQVDLDAELAAVLQAQYNSASSKQMTSTNSGGEHDTDMLLSSWEMVGFMPDNSSFTSKPLIGVDQLTFGLSPPASSSSKSKATQSSSSQPLKVKPPSKQEIEQSISREDGKESDDIICIVCHQSPIEYVTLPNCSQPHVYCMKCAQKLVEKGRKTRTPQKYFTKYTALQLKAAKKKIVDTPPETPQGDASKPEVQTSETPTTTSKSTKKPKKRRALPGAPSRPSSTITATCLLCKCSTEIDEKHGIEILRRRNKRRHVQTSSSSDEPPTKRQRTTPPEQSKDNLICPVHGEEYLLFCVEFMQLLCPQCLAQDSVHRKHNEDQFHLPLHDATVAVKYILESKIVSDLENRHEKLTKFVETLTQKRGRIAQSAQKNCEILKQQMQELQAILTSKLTEMTKQIELAAANKHRALDAQLKQAAAQITEIEKAQKTACSWLSAPEPTQDCSLLVDVDANMADVRQTLMFNMPVISRLMCTLAPINLQSLQTLLQRTKYEDYWKASTLNTAAIEVMLPPPHPLLDTDEDENDFINLGDSDEELDGNEGAIDKPQKFSTYPPFVGDDDELDSFALSEMSMGPALFFSDGLATSSPPSAEGLKVSEPSPTTTSTTNDSTNPNNMDTDDM